MPAFAEVREGVCRFRPRGECTLIDAVELITGAIAYCRERRVNRLLVDVTDLVGISVPSLVDRFLMVEEWAQEAKGEVVVALVVHADYIDPGRFGVKVAADFGLLVDVCTSEIDALNWLGTGARPA